MTKTAYKLTRENLTTYNDTQWVVGEWKEMSGEGELCGEGWLHAYESPELAALMCPIHVDSDYTALWTAEVSGKIKRSGTKLGATRMRILERVELPRVTTVQCVEIAIRCAMMVYKETTWTQWAEKWLLRTEQEANAAANLGNAAYAAAYAAEYAANAAYAAAYAAYAAHVVNVEYAAANAAYAVEAATADAAHAVNAAYAVWPISPVNAVTAAASAAAYAADKQLEAATITQVIRQVLAT